MFARVVRALLPLAVFASVVVPAEAQDRIAPGYIDIGFVAADAVSDDAGVAFGMRTEKLLKTLPSLGGGVLGVQLNATLSAYEFGLGHNWIFLPIGVAATYHFSPGNSNFDPYIAAGAGYRITICRPYPYIWADCSSEKDEVFGIARVGGKLFVHENVGFFLDGGLGSSYVSGGLVIRLK